MKTAKITRSEILPSSLSNFRPLLRAKIDRITLPVTANKPIAANTGVCGSDEVIAAA
jgi:hypothetical protein